MEGLERRLGGAGISTANELGESLLRSECVGVVCSKHDGSNTDTSAAEFLAGVVLAASHQELGACFE